MAAVKWGPPILEAQLGAFYPLLAAEDDAVVEAAPLPGLVRPGENADPRDELPWQTVYSGRLRETLRQPWRVAIDLRPLLPNALGGVVALRGSSGSWARRVLVSDSGVLVLRAESRARIWLRSLSTGEPVGAIGSSASSAQPNVPPFAANLVDWPSDLEHVEIATPEALVTVGRWQTRRHYWHHGPRRRGHLQLASPVVLPGGVVQVLGWMLAEGGATDAPTRLHWSLEVGRRQVARGELPWGLPDSPGAAAVALLHLPPKLDGGSLLLKAVHRNP